MPVRQMQSARKTSASRMDLLRLDAQLHGKFPQDACVIGTSKNSAPVPVSAVSVLPVHVLCQ